VVRHVVHQGLLISTTHREFQPFAAHDLKVSNLVVFHREFSQDSLLLHVALREPLYS
jgi:hypothetical protein